MDKYQKICIARYTLSLALLLQLLFIINSRTDKISSSSFILMGISAFFIFLVETEGKPYKLHEISRITNILLFLAIGFFAYKYK
jgi:hypothetical protein